MRRTAKIMLAAIGTAALASGTLFMLDGRAKTPPGIAAVSASAPAPGHAALDLRIWYPARPSRTGVLPLIVMSHGTGGSADGHSDTAIALAGAGFVVAAPTHPGDNFRDTAAVGKGTELIDRPHHIVTTIDYMLMRWPGRARIDQARIGMFGFSAGGFTGLVIAGAEPKLWRTAEYCRAHPQAWSCLYIVRQGQSPEELGKRRNVTWIHDPRVRALVIAAPAVGFSFDREALAKVRIPVQLWSAAGDDIVDDSPATIRAAMTTEPQFHGIAGAGHFSFLSPCSLAMRGIVAVMHWFGTEKICTDPAGFDRASFHERFNRDVVTFFQHALKPASPHERLHGPEGQLHGR